MFYALNRNLSSEQLSPLWRWGVMSACCMRHFMLLFRYMICELTWCHLVDKLCFVRLVLAWKFGYYGIYSHVILSKDRLGFLLMGSSHNWAIHSQHKQFNFTLTQDTCVWMLEKNQDDKPTMQLQRIPLLL